MKTLVMIPASASFATAFFSFASWLTMSRPPSVVTSWRPSGTSIAISGRMSHAMPTISAVAAISRFSLMCVSSRSRRTSWS